MRFVADAGPREKRLRRLAERGQNPGDVGAEARGQGSKAPGAGRVGLPAPAA
jgi:hypothetical protein